MHNTIPDLKIGLLNKKRGNFAIQAKLIGADNVVAMQADWTLPDDAIAAYLATFGRYGIPFNAVYGPGLPGGLALPELLSHDTVTQALDKASASK